MSVLEIVRYRVKDGVTPEAALAAWEKSMPFAEAQSGYVARRIAVTADGEWIDEVEWETMASAMAVADAFDPQKYPELLDLVAVLDESSMSMTHYTVQGSTA
ncbi:hypothetical protein [Shimia sp. Alg240-R146]|uniref:hypothetical protein n=1 Tax=Shimia sp. Alg240-R146 TaxID=2993449 RepID=UPI0022E97D9C|nr:hypothetical protein [Shimia sp. Alg240-R146]